jgi:L-fucose mutarotase
MLKGIPRILPPDLLKVLMEMGHGDEIVLTDANFPAASNACRLVRCDGSDVVEVLKAVMQFFPLDTFLPHPAALMAVVPGDSYEPKIWPEFRVEIQRHEAWFQEFEMLERMKFYERVRKAYAVVTTGDIRRYANIILRKGIIEIN